MTLPSLGLRRIGWRIFAPFTVLLVSVSVLFSIIGLQFVEKTIKTSAANELKILSVILSSQVQRQLSRIEQSLTSMENHGFLLQELRKPTPDKAALEDFLQKRLRMLPLFEDLAVFNRQGVCIGSTDPTWYDMSAKDLPFFINGLSNFNFSDIYTSDEGKIQLVSTRISNGTVTKGVLVGQVNMSSIYDLMDQKLGVSESTDAFLVDASMRFITPGKTAPDRLLESHLIRAPLMNHLNKDFWVDQYKNFNGQEVLGTVRKTRRWYVVVERDLAEVTRPIDDARKIILVATLLLVVVLIVLTFVLTRSITKPLMTLVDGAQRVAKGDFSKPFMIPKGTDEVAFLAAEFDKMRAKVAAFQERMTQRLEESERKRLESERLAAIGTLASTLAHEIRNPLNAMSLLLARLELAKGPEATRATVTRDLRAEIARLDRLVSDILDYARPLVLQYKEIDLKEFMTSLLELYRGLFEGKRIDCRVDIASGMTVRVDPDRLKQCLVNLLQNAVEAVGTAGHIDIEAHRSGGNVQITVRDDGMGLPPQPEGRLFDLFFTTKDNGTGLGLSTVKKIIDAHGGQISVTPRTDVGGDGRPAQGAEVLLSFPG